MNYKKTINTFNNRLKNGFIYSLLASSILLTGCGGSGDVSRFDDSDTPSPVGASIDPEGNVTPSAPGSNPATDEELQQLPDVAAGGRQFSDPNVIVALRGTAVAKGGANIVSINWNQLNETPDLKVDIATPRELETAIVVPDLQEETQLTFQLTVQDSEGRINASTTTIFVTPVPAFARVSAGIVNEERQEVEFTVRLNAPQQTETTVNYTTRDGTAEAGSDYEAAEGVLLYAAGEVEKTVAVTIYDTNVEEGNEFFSLNIAVLSDQNPSANSGNALITNNPNSVEMTQNITFTDAGPIMLVAGNTTSNPIVSESAPGSGSLTYASSDTSIATVDQSGSVTAIAAGSVTITATKAADPIFPLSVSSYQVQVASALAAPSISLAGDTGNAFTYSQDLPITPLRISNSGGAIASCTSDNLPAGLALDASTDGSTCRLSGTPTAAQAATQLTITATNTNGSSSLQISIEIREIAPTLVSPTTQFTFTQGEPIPTLRFVNNGGHPESCAPAGEGFVQGLSVNVSADGSTCEITGTPRSVMTFELFTQISATNTAGESLASFTSTVIPAVPELEAPTAPLTYTINAPITALTIANTGGGQLINCEADTLPAGLSIDVTEDDTCIIRGTPTALQSSTMHTVTAENSTGSSSVNLDITIEDIVFTGSIDLPYNTTTNISIGLAVSSGVARVDWNDGSPTVDITNQDLTQLTTNAGRATYAFPAANTGNITISFSDGIASLIGINGSSAPFIVDEDNIDFSAAINLRHYVFGSTLNQVNSSITNLAANHPNLEVLTIAGSGNFSGDLSELPRSLTIFNTSNAGGTLSGSIADLPPNLTRLSIFNNSGTLTGTTDEFPPNITQVSLQSNNTITGNISQIPASLTGLTISGRNAISGAVSEIPSTLLTLNISGVNTINGNIEDLHPDATSISISGNNQILGNVDNIRNNGSLNLTVQGQNQITGTTGGIPTSVISISLAGQNTMSGNIQDLHIDMRSVNFSGGLGMIVGGDIARISSRSISSLILGGGNTVAGNIANIPTTIRSLTVNGLNTLSGNIQDIHTDYFTFRVNGNNTIGGDLGLVQANTIFTFELGGFNSVTQFSDTPTWAPTRLTTFTLLAGASDMPGYNSATIDRILIFFDTNLTQTTQSSNARIVINRSIDSPRTTASDAAVQSLTNKGYRQIQTPVAPIPSINPA